VSGWSEHDECAANAPADDMAAIRTWSEAAAYVRRTAGCPDVVGHQAFDNMTEAVFERAKRERRARVAADMARLTD
jgi:hypothetical protein